MAFPVKKKIDTEFPKKTWGIKDAIQNKINNLLYEKKKDDGLALKEPRLLTIIIRKDKEHHFHFLRDETEFKVKGVWQDTHHKLFKEPNAEIQIQYLDNREGTITQKLDNLFKEYNKDYVHEKVLYVTSTPLESTSLNLEAGRK
jgi:hypothetical protein